MSLKIEHLSGWCPVQGFGQWDDQRFYFRARWDDWRLSIGPTDEDAVFGELVAEGEYENAGWMKDSVAKKLIRGAYKRWKHDRRGN